MSPTPDRAQWPGYARLKQMGINSKLVASARLKNEYVTLPDNVTTNEATTRLKSDAGFFVPAKK